MISSESIWEVLRPRLRRFVADTGDINLLKRYTDCEPATIGGWLAESVPLADKLIRVWHLMDMVGYDSPEMQELGELQRYVGRIYALGVIDDMSQLLELLQVTLPQTAIQFLRGQTSLQLKPEALPGLKAQYDAALEEAQRALPRAAPISSNLEDTVEIIESPRMSEVLLNTTDPALALAMLIGLSAPLARTLVLEGLPADRNRLRSLAGHPAVPTVFDFSRLMNALCSEAALREMR